MSIDPCRDFSVVARTTRGNATECWHFGVAAAVTPSGRLVASVGNPDTQFFLRSCAKPIQALPLVRGGGIEEFQLEPADIALICASHSGRPEHVRRVEELLRRGGYGLEHLQCGAHQPFDKEARLGLLTASLNPSVLHNSCSGKHAGMLLACKMMGFSVENYTSPQHPLQGLIFQAMMEVSGLEAADLKFGIDGCGLPTYRISLAAAAGIYAILAEPRASDLEATSIAALLRVGESMSREPEMVAGVGRFATALTQATGGRLIAKEGAEGAFGVAVRGPVSLGLALKIADGSERIRDSVVVDILRQLGCLSATEVGELESFVRVELTSHLGVPVGELLPDVELIGVE